MGNGASITENDATNYVNSAPNPTEGEKLWECTAKFWEHELYRERYKNAQNSWDDILKNTEQQIEIDGSLNNLDLILQQICYTVLDMDIAYNLTIDILDFCHGEKATFTPEELLIVKEKLRKKLCYADMRACKKFVKYLIVFTIISYTINKLLRLKNHCFPAVLDKQKCMVESREYQEECVRKYHNPKVANFDMYFGATKYCTYVLLENYRNLKRLENIFGF